MHNHLNLWVDIGSCQRQRGSISSTIINSCFLPHTINVYVQIDKTLNDVGKYDNIHGLAEKSHPVYERGWKVVLDSGVQYRLLRGCFDVFGKKIKSWVRGVFVTINVQRHQMASPHLDGRDDYC